MSESTQTATRKAITMYGQNPTPSEIRQAMAALGNQGIAKVVIEFSGGNDEGGPDSIDYFDAQGARLDGIAQTQAYEDRYWSGGKEHTRGWVVFDHTIEGAYADRKRPATEAEVELAKIAKVLEWPIYDRFGSFAGEFHAYGTVEWDVVSGTHRMSGQESHEVYEDF